MDVMFYEAFEEEAEALRRYLPQGITAAFTSHTIQESGHSTPPAGLISIRTQSRVPCDWSGPMRGLLSRSGGYDHLLSFLEGCAQPVPCGNLPEYCSRSVAEQAMLLWMALLRKLPRQLEQFNGFHRDGLTGRECEGRSLLVVGVGYIGHEICRIGNALGMDVRGVDIIRKHEDVSYTSIDEGIAWADIIVCAMNLTADNRGYFSYDLLRRIKPGGIFVNVSRGELSPPDVQLRLLDEKRLAGVGLDVFDHEPELAVSLRSGQDSDDPTVCASRRLMNRPDAILTPHNAFNTEEATDRKSMQSVRQVVEFLERGAFLWPVPHA